MNTIRNYVDIIKQKYDKNNNVTYIMDLLELEDENTYELFEVFRVIELNHKENKSFITDYEYLIEEDLLLQWKAEANYSELNGVYEEYKDDLYQVILLGEDYLLYDFLYTEMRHLKVSN